MFRNSFKNLYITLKDKFDNRFTKFGFTILTLLTISFVLLAIFVFKDSYLRFIHSIRDFGLSIAYYFTQLFEIDVDILPTVASLDSSYARTLFWVPLDFEIFKQKLGIYFTSLFNGTTAVTFFTNLGVFFADFSRFLLIIVPFISLFFIWFNEYFKENENSIDEKESRPLRFYKKTIFRFHLWIKDKIDEIKNNFNATKFFRIFWILIWLFNFNIITVVIEFFAFYFYFVISFDIPNIFIQVYKFLCDLKMIPLFVKLIAVILVLLYLRIRNAYRILNHMEMRNRGFLNSLGLVILITGVTGKGKTLMMTDLALSQEAMFRDKAFEKILNNDVKFPNFPYSRFETSLKKAIYYHQIYSLATAELWINRLRDSFEKSDGKSHSFGYDFVNFGLYYDNGLTQEYLFDMLEKYTKLFFIYTVESSLLISNYGIRVDGKLMSANHFPMWDSNFFRDSRLSEYYSRHSHIIDFDMLRLGKKVIDDNLKSDSVEFGVYVITEFDKERGNQLTNQSFKADSEEANPKNDLTELCEKIHRHSSTVDNYPFIRIFTDSQRAQSVMADNREIAEKIVHITDVGDNKNALAFFFYDELIYDIFFRRFESWYYRYRYARSDNTLFMYFFHKICAFVIAHHHKKENLFGFSIYSGNSILSSNESENDKFKWYRCNKKIYSNRYKSNCFKDYWTQKSLRSPIGINDLPEYFSTQASMDEMKSQHSYWIDKLDNVLNEESDDENLDS